MDFNPWTEFWCSLLRSSEFLRQYLSNISGSRTIAAAVILIDIAITIYICIDPSTGSQRGGTGKFEGGYICYIVRTFLILKLVVLVVLLSGNKGTTAPLEKAEILNEFGNIHEMPGEENLFKARQDRIVVDVDVLSKSIDAILATKEELVSDSLETPGRHIPEVFETCNMSDTYDDRHMQEEGPLNISEVQLDILEIRKKTTTGSFVTSGQEVEICSDVTMDVERGSEELIESEIEASGLSLSEKSEMSLHEHAVCQKGSDSIDVCHSNLLQESQTPQESYSYYKKESSSKKQDYTRDFTYGRLPERGLIRDIEARAVPFSSLDNILCDIFDYMRRPHSVTPCPPAQETLHDEESFISIEPIRGSNHLDRTNDVHSMPRLPITSDMAPDDTADHGLREEDQIYDNETMAMQAGSDTTGHGHELLDWNQTVTRASGMDGRSNLVYTSVINCVQEENTHGIALSHDSDSEVALQRLYTCVVCLDVRRTFVFMPCNHLVCCASCANMVSKCPVCRAEIRRKLRVHYN